MMNDAYILSALRTPVGRYGGALKDIRPDDLAALVIRTLVDRAGISPADVADVYLGCANQAGEDNRNVARMAALLAGLPVEVPGVTVNRLCGSGLEAVNQAARAVMAGDGEVFIAGGVESMTRAPFVFGKPETAYSRQPPQVFDSTIGWRFTNPRLADMGHTLSLGETAEQVAERYGITREEQDRFALDSQRKAAAAAAAGRFGGEIIPVAVKKAVKGQGESTSQFTADEHPRPDTTLDDLAKLKPAFKPGGTVTAGNSSGINDGAAAVLISTPEARRTARLEADGPHRRHGRGRRRPVHHGHGSRPGDAQGAGEGGLGHKRPRPG